MNQPPPPEKKDPVTERRAAVRECDAAADEVIHAATQSLTRSGKFRAPSKPKKEPK